MQKSHRKVNRIQIQKSLQLPQELLEQRLQTLISFSTYLESTYHIKGITSQQQDEKQRIKSIGYKDQILHLNGYDYQLNKLDQSQRDSILGYTEQLYQSVECKADKLTQVRHMSAVEFYLITNKCNVQDTLHFDQNDICTICQFELFEIDDWNDIKKVISNDSQVIGLQCDHFYHLECLDQCVKEQHIQCPICFRIYGIKTGDQPEGDMIVFLDRNIHCEGYEDVGVIVIQYFMHGGERNEQLYPPTRRDVFIPDCVEGRRLLRQLKVAFERKLIFTVGRSVTTGKDNRIVWNGIHHKTSINGGTHRFGWPDNTYFNRVTEELAAKGIF